MFSLSQNHRPRLDSGRSEGSLWQVSRSSWRSECSQRGKPQPKSEPRIARMGRPFASFAQFAAKKSSQKSKETRH